MRSCSDPLQRVEDQVQAELELAVDVVARGHRLGRGLGEVGIVPDIVLIEHRLGRRRFTINQSFLLGTTAFIVIPALMVFGALVLRPRVNRVVNIATAILYALTIVAGAIGEWNYYLLGSAIEVALLAAVAYYARAWPREARSS